VVRSIVLATVLALVSTARAGSFWEPAPKDTSARDRLVELGDQHLEDAQRSAAYSDPIVPPYVLAAARAALGAYDRALAIGPETPAIHFRAVLAAGLIDQKRGLCRECRDGYEAVVRHTAAIRRLQPLDPYEPTLANNLGVSYSKLGGLGGPDADHDFAIAVDEYEHWRRLAGSDLTAGERARSYSNEAEILMALGRLEEAIRYYRMATEADPFEPLNWFGLAVAYDRDEQWAKAVEATQRAVNHGVGLGRLDSEGVFFVPEGDYYYYMALAHHVLGKLDVAESNYNRFLVHCKDTKYAARAREHLAELKGAAKK
jgi:tetratricopeptide (TPR) repeat protein